MLTLWKGIPMENQFSWNLSATIVHPTVGHNNMDKFNIHLID